MASRQPRKEESVRAAYRVQSSTLYGGRGAGRGMSAVEHATTLVWSPAISIAVGTLFIEVPGASCSRNHSLRCAGVRANI